MLRRTRRNLLLQRRETRRIKVKTKVEQPSYQTNKFLPPANEVWGKVIFLHLSVSHSVHRGGGTPRGQTSPPKMATEAGCTDPTGIHSCHLWLLNERFNERFPDEEISSII